MKVSSLYLRGFRNLKEVSLGFDDGINVISGKNAQGKTNLLEAVFMLSGGRSFRTRFDREIIGFSESSAEIMAEISSGDREQRVQILLSRGTARKILKNGVKKTGAELSEDLKAVLFCPDDLNIIKDGAAARRRLLDMAISQLRPGYAKLLSDYVRLYENKLRILKDYGDNAAMMDTLDDFSLNMCKISAQLIRYRASFSRRLSAAAAPIHAEFSGVGEALSIDYKTVSTISDPMASAAEIFEELCEHYFAHKAAEIRTASCLSGAHKDDLEIALNSQSARAFASQGQTRTAALSIKLAEREIFLEETGEYPILLLDDVLSELDATRQEFVLNRIGGGQTLISCCEDGEISRKTGGRVIFIENGEIKRE